MKKKKLDYTRLPWTPFEEFTRPADDYKLYGPARPPDAEYRNSRYHVGLWQEGASDHPLGIYVHLSIKDHGRSTRHDWRDFQRIKNELVGPEYEAIELYPAESRLVDSANQYHLFVFQSWKVPVGFPDRLVADDAGSSNRASKAVQRPFEERPADCLTGKDLDAMVYALKTKGV